MTDEDIKELKRLTNHFFYILALIHGRTIYRDELSADMRRIDSELEELDQEFTDCTKKIGEYLLKSLMPKE